jgi:hypothetical protein
LSSTVYCVLLQSLKNINFEMFSIFPKFLLETEPVRVPGAHADSDAQDGR